MVGSLGDRLAVQRWQVLGGLAVGSILPELFWRFFPDLAYALAGYLDILALGFIITQSVAGSSRIGLAVGWLLIGYMTYQYVPFLYPDEFDNVVRPTGFRLLTAFGTMYFGIFFWGAVFPAAVPVSLVTVSSGREFGQTLLILLAGIIGGGIGFGIYLSRWQPEELYHEGSDFVTLIKQFFKAENEIVEQALSGHWRSIFQSQELAAYVMLPAIICALVGLVGVVLNLFYPLPEGALLIGLLLLRIQADINQTPSRSPDYEVDLRLLDSISGATRNLKGTMMVLTSLIGMLNSAVMFFVSTSGLVESVSSSGGGEAASSAIPVWLAGIFLATFVVSLLLMGIYSLIHWVRQLERLEPYANTWGQLESGEQEDVSIAVRPPGLLVPANMPFFGILLAAVLLETNNYLVGMGVGAGLFGSSIILMGWGLSRTWRGPPQPLTHESRDVTATLILQMGVMLMFGAIDIESLQLNTDPIWVFGMVSIIVICIVYIPEIGDSLSREKGMGKLLRDIPGLLLFLFIGFSARVFFEGSTVLIEAVLFLLAAVLILSTVLEVYLERIT